MSAQNLRPARDAPAPTIDPHQQQREDLAAAFRWFARLGMAEAVANPANP